MPSVSSRSAGAGLTTPELALLLARAGWQAVACKGDKLTGFRQLLSAATEHHHTGIAAKKKLAATAVKLREAKRSIESLAPHKPAR